MIQIFNYNTQKKQAILAIKVKAGAKINSIGKFVVIHDRQYLKISIKAAPEMGKANNSIIDFLSQEWQIKQNNIEIISGHTNKFKIITLKNLAFDYLNLILSNYMIDN